jgi:uncharacterized protein YkwD
MARRYTSDMNSERYLANTGPWKREVHDLDNEKTNCQIDEIIRAGNDWPYNSLAEARAAAFDNWYYCLSGSTR